MKQKWQQFLLSLGPGILFASTSIGVSHLVQSTRAGATYGFGLVWAILLANLLKYPFFEYGSRYANATGTSLIDGYQKQGKWALGLYILITVLSMFFVSAAVGAVTAGFLDQLFGISAILGAQGSFLAIVLLVSVVVVVLWLGQYQALDKLIKLIGAVLLLSTLAAVVLLIFRGPVDEPFRFFAAEALEPGTVHFAFLIALMGWMPTAIDLSTWNSLWTLARIKQSGYRPTLRQTIFEFRTTYIITALLAPCFVLLGAYLLYGTSYQMPASAADFANAVVQLYVQTFGAWSSLIITAAAFSIMFGTAIAVFDGYARAAQRVWYWVGKPFGKWESHSQKPYRVFLLLLAGGTVGIVFYFSTSLKTLVDIATTLSFVLAPVIAAMNFRLVTHRAFPRAARPGVFLRTLSIAGIVFLTAFSLLYLYQVVLA